MSAEWIKKAAEAVAGLMPDGTFLSFDYNVRALMAVVLVSLVCGAVSSLVVGNRMAFFSDALAHCTFAGVTLGFVAALFGGARGEEEFWNWIIPVMIGFGVLVGLGIAFVRENTSLANDTVIGVFFAGAIGLGALLLKGVASRRYFTPENFLFGDPSFVKEGDVLQLLALAAATGAVLVWLYNQLVFTSFNASLARSRRVAVRLCNYVFIVLLAVIVNLCVKTVGALLINALLVVPAATAANVCRNLRQLFWVTVALSVGTGVAGQWLSWEVELPDPGGDPNNPIRLSTGGTIVVLSVLLFFVSMAVGPWLRERRGGGLAKAAAVPENAAAS